MLRIKSTHAWKHWTSFFSARRVFYVTAFWPDRFLNWWCVRTSDHQSASAVNRWKRSVGPFSSDGPTVCTRPQMWDTCYSTARRPDDKLTQEYVKASSQINVSERLHTHLAKSALRANNSNNKNMQCEIRECFVCKKTIYLQTPEFRELEWISKIDKRNNKGQKCKRAN